MKLQNQTVLITGATTGIGFNLAVRLHEMGNKIIICGRKKDRLDEIREKYKGIDTYLCDVSDAAQRESLAQWAIENYPELNVLVNNAGLMQIYDLNNAVDLNKVTAEVTTNLVAPIHLGSLFVRHLQRQETAAIINITSGLAFTPYAKVPVYCATKAGMHSFCLSLRYQLKDTSVKVFEIIPPAVATDLGHADNYDRSNDHAISVEEFTDHFIEVLGQDKYEVGIASAEALHLKREAMFGVLNP